MIVSDMEVNTGGLSCGVAATLTVRFENGNYSKALGERYRPTTKERAGVLKARRAPIAR